MNFRNIIPNIASGFEFNKGEIVLLQFWGDNSDLDILDKFAIEVGKMGAVPLKVQNSREFIKDYYSAVDKDALVMPDKYFDLFKIADSVIEISMYPFPAPHKDFPREKIDEYRTNMINTMRSIMPGKDKYIQLRVPTEENAIESGLSFEEFEKAMLDAYSIDYKSLKEEASGMVDKLSKKTKVTIHTDGGRKLDMSLEGRSWFKDDGCGDMPCGEIYIAPVESSVNGSIIIPEINIEGTRFKSVEFKFDCGKVVSCSESEIESFISECPGDSDMFAELGIGMNKNINRFLGYPLLDEKMVGTAHIAIGMNNMFGGNNDCPMHMDFIFKPEKMIFDDEEIVL